MNNHSPRLRTGHGLDREDGRPSQYPAAPDAATPRAIAGGSNDVRFQLLPLAEINWTASSASYLVKGILPATGLVLIYGKPKTGKSFWTHDLVMHVARGNPYRGMRVGKGVVIYVAAEGGHGFRKRIAAYRQRHDCDGAQFFLCTVRPDLAADHELLIGDILAQTEGEHPAVVVVDTINRSLVGNENDAKDMGRYLRAAAAIEDVLGCCVVLVHHTGHEAGRPRGHSALSAAVDVQIAIEDRAGDLVATVELAKDGPAGLQLVSRLEPVKIGVDADGDAITSCVVVAVDGPPQRRTSKRMPKQVEQAHGVLADVISERGKNHMDLPPEARAVTSDEWREECSRRGVGGNNKESWRKAFQRSNERLEQEGIIGRRGDLVWLKEAS